MFRPHEFMSFYKSTVQNPAVVDETSFGHLLHFLLPVTGLERIGDNKQQVQLSAKIYYERLDVTQEPGAVKKRGWQGKNRWDCGRNRWNSTLNKAVHILSQSISLVDVLLLFESEYLVWEDFNANSLGVTFSLFIVWKCSFFKLLFMVFSIHKPLGGRSQCAA